MRASARPARPVHPMVREGRAMPARASAARRGAGVKAARAVRAERIGGQGRKRRFGPLGKGKLGKSRWQDRRAAAAADRIAGPDVGTGGPAVRRLPGGKARRRRGIDDGGRADRGRADRRGNRRSGLADQSREPCGEEQERRDGALPRAGPVFGGRMCGVTHAPEIGGSCTSARRPATSGGYRRRARSG